MNDKNFVSSFKIPEEMAKELSELLIQQSIRERLLIQLVDNEAGKYNAMEKLLVEIETKINSIKNIITTTHVPEEFRSEKFIWNYDGWDISGNTCFIYEN